MHLPYRRILAAAAPLVAIALALLSLPATSRAGVPPHVLLSPVMTSVDYDDGRFSIFVPLRDLDHHGRITYDDNRDTVPDRDLPSVGLGAFELFLYFDPDVVRVEAADPGPFIENSGRVAQCFDRAPRRGEYALACVTTGAGDGAQGSGTLATITLRPIANGTSFLRLEAQLSGPLGDSIPIATDGAVVEVRGGPDEPPAGSDGGSGDGDPRPIGGPDGGNGTGGNSQDGASGDGTGGNGNGGGPNGGNTNDPADPGAPSAGTGYRPFENPGFTLAGLLALAGGVLLLVWSRVAVRTDGD